MTTISAAIITLNEERNIRRCIQSLRGCVDEIVVLDSFSSDSTQAICIEEGVKFIQKEWMGYSAAKNFLNEQTSCEYIFSIDADEALNEDMRQNLIKLKSVGLSGTYSVNRITNYCGKWIRHSGWFPDIKLRLFPRGKAKWVGELVHEELELETNMPNTLLGGLLEHYSYYDYKQHRERADKYSRLTAKKYHELGMKCGFLRPIMSGIGRFISMYFIKMGFLDGKMGFMIALISAQSNIYKYKELRRLMRQK
jgi:(heptosyl)LPS beta-1,4-glucosyltransferase